MATSRFSESPWLNVLVVAVLPLAACALLFVSHQLLRPLSLAILVCAAAAALGLRAYARKLAASVAAIDAAAAPNQADVLVALFGESERRLLGISSTLEATSAVSILQRRRIFFLGCGALFRVVAVTSAIVALVLFFG